jgi:signal-transduction protein with cAMP-binding, CBS, and nucleotidyltransferase domain
LHRSIDRSIDRSIVTEKDILEKVVIHGKNSHQIEAKNIMSKPLVTIEIGQPTKEALNLMKKNEIRRIPITENKSLVGLIKERRLLKILGQY